MGDNERKENTVQEEGDRESLAPNAATADEVGTEVRDALLALTAEVKVISERIESLKTSQQRVWHCMQENADGQDQLMVRMQELEQRQGNLAQQQRKFQDAQDGRLDEIIRRLSAVEVVQKKMRQLVIWWRRALVVGLDHYQAWVLSVRCHMCRRQSSTTLMLICRTRGLTLSVMSQCGSGSCLIPRDVRGTEIFCRKSRCIMDLAETRRKMGVRDSMPAGG